MWGTMAADYEKLGLFYLGKRYDLASNTRQEELILYDSRDLLTHAVILGMTSMGRCLVQLPHVSPAFENGLQQAWYPLSQGGSNGDTGGGSRLGAGDRVRDCR